MISQADLAAYWQSPERHGFVRPKFDVRVNEFSKAGRFVRPHTQHVQAWTAEEAKASALRQLLEYRDGKFSVEAIEFSQPVTWGIVKSTAADCAASERCYR